MPGPVVARDLRLRARGLEDRVERARQRRVLGGKKRLAPEGADRADGARILLVRALVLETVSAQEGPEGIQVGHVVVARDRSDRVDEIGRERRGIVSVIGKHDLTPYITSATVTNVSSIDPYGVERKEDA